MSSISAKPIQITLFRWAGKWGPFKIKIPCGECAITKDILSDLMANELQGVPIKLDDREWLSQWWKPLIRGAYHAPIVIVENKVVSQGEAVNRGAVCHAVIQNYVERFDITDSVIFGKTSCPYCQRAKAMLDEAQIPYQFMDVIKNMRALYEMFPRAKKHLGYKTPITVPQIWLEGKYIGGADQLALYLKSAK